MVENNGKIVDYFSITDYAQAAHEFAEGSKSLEELLINCFNLRIVTRACCAGHETMNGPLIMFEDVPANHPYILNIIKHLHKSGCHISYNFAMADLGAAWSFQDTRVTYSDISIEKMWDYEKPNSETTMFKDITAAILSTDINHNYEKDLTEEMSAFVSYSRYSEITRRVKQHFSTEYVFDKLNEGVHTFTLDSSGPTYDVMNPCGKATNTTCLKFKVETESPAHFARLLDNLPIESYILEDN